MSRFIARVFLAILFTLPMNATAQNPAHRLNIIASFSIIADMAKEVAGENANIITLVAAGGDPHVYQPSPTDVRNITRADIILINGLGFDGWMDRLVASAEAKGRVVTVSKGVTPIRVHGEEIDPHAWQDISNGMIYVDHIRDALIQADPAHAAHYRHNAERYLERLIDLDHWVKTEIEEVPEAKRSAITSHDALRYFARTYHIHFIAAQGLSTEGEVSAKSIAAIIDQIRKEKVKVLFLENMSNPDLINQLADDSDAIIGGVLYSDSLSEPYEDGATYISMFRHNVKILTDSLKK